MKLFTASFLLLLFIHRTSPLTFDSISNFKECKFQGSQILICVSEDFTTKFPKITDAITYFQCHDCVMPEIPTNAFQSAGKLATIQFRVDGLLKVQPNAFAGLSSLREVEIVNKKLPVTGATNVELHSLLSDKTELRKVTITRVLVTSLQALFIGSSVQKVSLDSTNLQTINDRAFSSASGLTELKIANPTAAFPLKFLAPLSALEIFEMSGNKETSFLIPASVKKLKELHFSRGSFLRISPQAFGGSVTTLRSFKLEHCTAISHDRMEEVEKLANLEILSFRSSAAITAVPPPVKKLRSLKHLTLSGTGIAAIGATDLPQFGVLQSLIAEIKNLRTLHIDAFDKLNLSELHFSHVPQPQVLLRPQNSTWKSLFDKVSRTLQSLRMVDCKLTDAFWAQLSGLSHLRKLALNFNEFTKIQDFFFGSLTKMEALELNYNKISALNQKSTYGIPYSAVIGLADNLIKTIDNCTFAGRDVSNKVNLDKNPFKCDCGLLWLHMALATPGTKSLHVTCGSGPHSGKKLASLNLTCAAGAEPPPCSLIPVTTPVPPPPPASFAVVQDGNEVRVSVNDSLRRWYREGIVFYSVVGASGAFRKSPVFKLDKPSEPLEGLASGKSYNICVVVAKGPIRVTNVSLTNGNDRHCEIFLFIAVNQAHVGLIAGLGTMGAILFAVIVVLIVWCWLRKRHPEKKADPYDDDKEDIYETYVYPPSSSIYSPAPASSVIARPATKRFVRQSDMTRSGTQSTVLDSAPGASRFDLSRSTVSLAVQNRHTNHGSTMLSGRAAAPDTRKFMSMHDLAAPAKRPTNSYMPSASRSMDELGPGRPPRAPYVPNKERANRDLPNPKQEEYAYIEEGEEYSKTPTPKSPQTPSNEYLRMGDTDSQYMSMSSAHSLDQDGPTKPADEGYGPVVTPTDTYGPQIQVETRGASRRPHRATESQLSLVNNRESAEDSHYNNRPSNLNISSKDIGSF